jgi:hypothetical protein
VASRDSGGRRRAGAPVSGHGLCCDQQGSGAAEEEEISHL